MINKKNLKSVFNLEAKCLPSGAPSQTTKSAGSPSKCETISSAVETLTYKGNCDLTIYQQQ